ncbi:uncharacterized protein LOC102807669 [Saccoglossus kowalevskii]|uniref:Uncharacterized protein LOC102807669 n=1 Tax=Saccoglossus kowalevskii TaxID=10224 RepID=A0ABM0MRB0_SACKO|nr:PREDICTED: uncharacterized protein LOC102807669 [Saccoglossus kowalevskii]
MVTDSCHIIVLLTHCLFARAVISSNSTSGIPIFDCAVDGGCLNGGTCVYLVCLCQNNFRGDRCEFSTLLPNCANDSDCNFQGSCVDGFCQCDVGYHGNFCQHYEYHDISSNWSDVEVDYDNYTSRVIVVAAVVSTLSLIGVCLCCVCVAMKSQPRGDRPPNTVVTEGERRNVPRYAYRPSWYGPFENRRLSSISDSLVLPDGRRVHIPSYPDGNSNDGDSYSLSQYRPNPDQPPDYSRLSLHRQNSAASSVPETPPPTYEAALNLRFKFKDGDISQIQPLEEVPEDDEVFLPSDASREIRTRVETDV